MVTEPIVITCAQENPTVGNIDGNARIILDIWKQHDKNSDLVLFPELFLCGYPPEDLVLNTAFITSLKTKIDEICRASRNFQSAALVPTIWRTDNITTNAALLIEKGKIQHIFYKHKLPNDHVFDEPRTFTSGSLPEPYNFKGHLLGFMICEDVWHAEVPQHLKDNGAEILIVINGSPFHIHQQNQRNTVTRQAVLKTGLDLIYLNMIGGQDELVFDGCSFVMHKDGSVLYQSPDFEEDIFSITIKQSDNTTTNNDTTNNDTTDNDTTDNDTNIITSINIGTSTNISTSSVTPHNNSTSYNKNHPPKSGSDYVKYTPSHLELLYKALVTGLHDYAHKNGFKDAILGLSGGIDSALTAAIAADALGHKHVHCILLPSNFTSNESNKDAKECASLLNISHETIPISEILNAFESTIPNLKAIAHENTQSRIRGAILMALSNMNGSLLLTTGNKSEVAVGYCTLYGDMNGGFNPLKDVYKTDVYKLAKWRNEQENSPVIPKQIINKPPTAELRPNQKDEDSLPPYDLLDDILRLLIDYDDLDWSTASQKLLDMRTKCLKHPKDIEKIAHLLKINEYKRYQAPLGTRISNRDFGRDRRYPITNHFINKIEKP